MELIVDEEKSSFKSQNSFYDVVYERKEKVENCKRMLEMLPRKTYNQIRQEKQCSKSKQN